MGASVKYTIEGFQQSVLVGWGLDATDAIILRYLVDFYHSGRIMAKLGIKTVDDALSAMATLRDAWERFSRR
jgi:hypothetical protein